MIHYHLLYLLEINRNWVSGEFDSEIWDGGVMQIGFEPPPLIQSVYTCQECVQDLCVSACGESKKCMRCLCVY